MDILTTALDKLGFDWQIALANLVNFAIVFWLLNKFVFKGLRQTISKRAEIIQQGLDNATRSETILQQAHDQAQEISNQARQDAAVATAQIVKSAEELAATISDRAQEKAKEVIQNAEQSAQQKIEQIVQIAKEKSIESLVRATETILKSEISKQGHSDFVKVLVTKNSA